MARICWRLDGLPLAIELAAPRIKLFSPAQMLERLDRRLGLLVRGPRDLPARQRTLRDTLDWSFNLLDEEEQKLYACLSVFQGGRTIAAVEAVCGTVLRPNALLPALPGGGEPIVGESFDQGDGMLAGLESLLNKNLLYQKEGPDEEPRFYMLETIHEYARERLRERELQQLMQDRHLDYYLQRCEAMAPGYLRRGQLLLFKQTEADMADIRTAFDWERQSGQFEKGARLITAVSYYLRYATERVVEGYRLARCLLPFASELSLPCRVPLLISASELAFQNDDIPHYRRLARRAQNLAREVGEKRLLAWSPTTKERMIAPEISCCAR